MKYKILDLFCGGGGAAKGYHDAGFEVVGIDAKFQPDYPYTFIQANALSINYEQLEQFDAIHASPPCQAYSAATVPARAAGKVYPDLYHQTRAMLAAAGKPFVIENVVGSPLRGNVKRLCGTQFGLKVFRHRLFECNWPLTLPDVPCTCKGKRIGEDGYYCCFGDSCTKAQAAKAMEIDWITNKAQLMESIPPAYTRFIGAQFVAYLESLATGAHKSLAPDTLAPGAHPLAAAAKVSGLASHNSHSTIRIHTWLMELFP